MAARRLAELPGLGSQAQVGPVATLRLQPLELISAEALQLPLWGGLGEEDRIRARLGNPGSGSAGAGSGATSGSQRWSRPR